MLTAIIIFNLPGITMAAIAFAAAFGITKLSGDSSEGIWMMVAGPLCAVFDLFYRFNAGARRWFSPDSGGSLFFIPLWILGIFWLVLGIVYTVQGRN